MRFHSVLGAIVLSLATSGFVNGADPAPAGDWKLVWSDEFDGAALDRTKWDYQFGNGFYNYDASQWISGWGNEELQYYTDQTENVSVVDGHLHIRAIKQSLHGCGYTSGRIVTRRRDGTALFAKKYGRFEFRAQMPSGKGVWPALWMLPHDETYGGWAASGEIDIVEIRGHEPKKVLGTLHYGGRWPANDSSSREFNFLGDEDSTGFHTYELEWEPGEIRWSIDGKTYATQNFWWSTDRVEAGKGQRPRTDAEAKPWPAPFDQPFYLVMNVAVGGRFPGKPEPATKFPAEMVVDYVRVYDRTSGYDDVKPRGEGMVPLAK